MSTMVAPREDIKDLVRWENLSSDEAGWQRALSSHAYVEVLGSFGVVELHGRLGGEDGAVFDQVSMGRPLKYLVAVPREFRPVVRGGEGVTVLVYFLRP